MQVTASISIKKNCIYTVTVGYSAVSRVKSECEANSATYTVQLHMYIHVQSAV